jgi:hypothetical protein
VRDKARRITMDTVLDENNEHLGVASIDYLQARPAVYLTTAGGL